MDTKTQYNITPKIHSVNRQHAKLIMFQKQVGKFSVIRITHHPLKHMEHITEDSIGLKVFCCVRAFVCVIIDIPFL